MQEKDIRPIAVRGSPGAPGADAQALVATTLTLMTAYALSRDEEERASAASRVAANLRALVEFDELGKDFRRICARLQSLWEAQAE